MRHATLVVSLAGALLAPAAPAPAATVQPGDPYIGGNCTLGWLFDGPRGDVYFSTAAHCVEDGQVVHLVGEPPVQNVVVPPDGEELGTVVVRGDETVPSSDVALIKVRDAVKPRVAGELRGHPGIPSGAVRTAEAAAGDALQLSGWGMGVAATEPTRERRQGVFVSGFEADGAWRGLTPATFGDSGGPVAHVPSKRALGLMKGYGCSNDDDNNPLCSAWGPSIAGIEKVAAAAGFPLTIRKAGQAAPVPALQPAGQQPSSGPPAPAPPSRTHGAPPAPCRDAERPSVAIGAVTLRRRGLTVVGTASDAGCNARVAQVEVALALRARGRCRHLVGGRLGRRTSCAPRFAAATGADRWSLTRRAKLPRGFYVVAVRVIDAAGSVAEARRTVRVR